MKNIRTNNIERFLGYSQLYNQNRPVPPHIIVKILIRYLTQTHNRVVDVGCGTGLSTFMWLDQAKDIIEVDPDDDIRESAITQWRAQQDSENLLFVKELSVQLDMDSDSVDILTCSLSFHWMDL